MIPEKAKELTTEIFELIKKATTIESIKAIENHKDIPEKNQMKTYVYPKIEFDIRPKEIEKLKNDSIIDLECYQKKHKPIIEKYKNWLTSDELTKELKNQKEYIYHLDKLLFALGKTIKSTKIVSY